MAGVSWTPELAIPSTWTPENPLDRDGRHYVRHAYMVPQYAVESEAVDWEHELNIGNTWL